MATYTTNLSLIKPGGSDKIRIAQINQNMDTIDEKIGAVGNTSLQAQVTAQNTAIRKVQKYTNSYDFASVSAFESKMTELLTGMEDNSKLMCRLHFTATDAPFVNTYTYFAELCKLTGNFATIVIYLVGGFANIIVSKTSSGYTYANISTDSCIIGITNFNNFKPDGAYAFTMFGRSISDGATNAPFTGDSTTFNAICFGTSTYSTQLAISEYSTNDRNRGRIFTRTQIAGTWSVWKEICEQKISWLASGTDLDDVIQPGVYGLSTLNSYTHGPVSGTIGGIMEVFGAIANGTYCIQRITNSANIYTRYRSASSGTAFAGWYKYTGTAL